MFAYVLLSVDSAKENEILDALADFSEIDEVRILFGEWDMICKVEAENPDALATFVMENIRSLPGVTLTSTMIVAR